MGYKNDLQNNNNALRGILNDINKLPESNTQGGGNCRSYDITLAKASGWVLLTTLDSDVLEHINDSRLIVTLRHMDDYEYEFYSGTLYTVGNNQIGSHGTEPVYGIANRKTSETVTSTSLILAPAGNTSKENDSGMGRFVVENGKYYIKPGDGFINAGNWRLTFIW